MAAPLRAALRRAARRMAFRSHRAGAPPHLARGAGRYRARHRRRALGAVPAVSRSRPDRHRRGTRERLQAGRRRHLQRARHGDRAGAAGERAGDAGVGHAVAGNHRQCRERPLRPAASAGPPWRRQHGRDRGARSAQASAAARPVPLAGPARGDARDLGAQQAGAAFSQSPRLRAAHLVPHLRPSSRMPELHGLAGRASLSRPADLPSLRLQHAAPCRVPVLRRRGQSRRLRPRRRTPARRSAACISPRRAPWCWRRI